MEEYSEFNKSDFEKWLSSNGDTTHRLNYNLNNNSVVFDLGGFRGEWANKIFKKYGSNIYIFEPIKEFYNGISKMFFNNAKVHAFNYGVGDKNETVSISITDDSSSVYNSEGQKETIQIKSLLEFLKTNNIHAVDLIKINIEGGEYNLLEDLINNNMTFLFNNIQVQFHRFIPNCVERRNKIRENLSKTHDITYDYEFIWENWRIKQ